VLESNPLELLLKKGLELPTGCQSLFMRGFDFGQVFFCDPFVASAFDRRRVIDLWPIPKHLRTQSPHPRLKPLVPWEGIPLLMAFFKKTIGFYSKDVWLHIMQLQTTWTACIQLFQERSSESTRVTRANYQSLKLHYNWRKLAKKCIFRFEEILLFEVETLIWE